MSYKKLLAGINVGLISMIGASIVGIELELILFRHILVVIIL